VRAIIINKPTVISDVAAHAVAWVIVTSLVMVVSYEEVIPPFDQHPHWV
jgi:hypothetical protein